MPQDIEKVVNWLFNESFNTAFNSEWFGVVFITTSIVLEQRVVWCGVYHKFTASIVLEQFLVGLMYHSVNSLGTASGASQRLGLMNSPDGQHHSSTALLCDDG